MDSCLVHSKLITVPRICPDRHGPLSGNRSSSLHMFDLNGLVCFVFILFVIVGKSLLKEGGAHSRGDH